MAIVLCNGLGHRGLGKSAAAVSEGASLLESLVIGIAAVEKEPDVPHVGLGGNPNMLGVLQTDAAVMDGDTLDIGCIGALEGFESTVKVAYELMRRLPHTMLVGAGAARFAAECGMTPQTNGLTDTTAAAYRSFLNEKIPVAARAAFPDVSLIECFEQIHESPFEKDTVVYLGATDSSVAGATSTSGWDFKYPGRIGDSPIIGAGMYADSRYGAAACTHTGEMTMRTCTAFSVVAALGRGAEPTEACMEAAAELKRLSAGTIGPVVIHALTSSGLHAAVFTGSSPVDYFVWQSEQNQITRFQAHPLNYVG